MVDIDMTLKTATKITKETEHFLKDASTEGNQRDPADQVLQDFEKTVKASCFIGKQVASGWSHHTSNKPKEVQEDITI